MERAVIVCHRGASLLAPENTFASLEKAIETGADVVELDVRQSRDGVLYVMHDESLDRTTSGRGGIAETSSDEIDNLDAGSWFSPAYSGEPVPRLDAFLDACKGRIATYVEIKKGDPAEVRDLLAVRGMLNDAWTFSFDQSILARARASVPDLKRMVLYEHVGSVDRAVAQDARVLEFHEDNLDPAVVSQAKESGLVTQMFYAGDRRQVFVEALQCGIEQMNIDHVDVFRSVEKDALADA